MKVFSNGFNLYGQLIKPNELIENFSVLFESEVIKNFEINHSFSFMHTHDLVINYRKTNQTIPLHSMKIRKIISNDERIIILCENGDCLKLDCDEEFTIKMLVNLLNDGSTDKITNVSCGSKMTVFYSEMGKVFTLANPLKFEKMDIIQIECGREHCLLLDQTGNIYSFGRGSRGQLGHGLLDDESEPLLIEALAGINIVKVSAGGWHSCALSADGDLYTWGWNSNGQLGMSSSTEKQVTVQATPHLIDNIGEDLNISMVAAGNRHTIVLTENKHLYGSGWNKYMQLKNDTKEEYYSFAFLYDFSNEEIIDLKAGPWNSAVICK